MVAFLHTTTVTRKFNTNNWINFGTFDSVFAKKLFMIKF